MTTQRPGIARRLASMLYEILLLLGVLSVTFIMPHILLGVFANRSVGPTLTLVHFVVVLLAYFVWFWLHGGQTLAMKTWKLRIVNTDGGRLRPLQAVLRYLAAWPSVTLFGIGILWALVDKDRQFLHDRIAGTRVIFEAS
ncbi:MAG TPA: RDD family protein [Rhodocyclaceae bacterium]|nr:RDD family protein [Rhodocyclaceae bacterium]